MMRILTIIGARPQFVKAAVVSRAIMAANSESPGSAMEVIVHTGQHYDVNMSDVFFREMAIPDPQYHLGVCNASHGVMTGRMLEAVEDIIMKEQPQVVLVYGDTNSTLAGALAASKLHVPVAHVEAGLRSFNMYMPEEINRILTDHVSTFLFCPTETAVRNLSAEGIGGVTKRKPTSPVVANVGDVMFDAAMFYRRMNKTSPSVKALMEALGSAFYLATIHRAENTDAPERLRSIVEALDTVSCHTPVLMPIHPRTRKIMMDGGLYFDHVKTIDPVGYFDMIALLDGCSAVFTDSGGLQKEAFFFGKHCITLREETEWVELVEGGFNSLAGADRERILAAEKVLNGKSQDFSARLYGEGNAGETIVQALLKAKL